MPGFGHSASPLYTRDDCHTGRCCQHARCICSALWEAEALRTATTPFKRGKRNRSLCIWGNIMTVWQVQLEGEAHDLSYLAQVLANGPRTVVYDERTSGYAYQSESFLSSSTPEEVGQLAVKELAVLSGVLKIERNARTPLAYGGVYRLNADGTRDIFVSLQFAIDIRADFAAVTCKVTDAFGNVIASPPPPPPRALVLFNLAAKDNAVAKVLRLLSAAEVMTWVGMYRLYEVVEEDVGGQHQLEKKSWGSPEDLKRFKHSANSVEVGGDSSRHGKEAQTPPKNPMSLAEAEAYCRYIVQAWLAYKGA